MAKSEKKPDMRTSVEVKLDFPVTADGRVYNSLTMRRPRMKDMIKAAKSPGTELEQNALLIADLCDVSPDVIEEVEMAVDMQRLGAQLDAFRAGQAS